MAHSRGIIIQIMTVIKCLSLYFARHVFKLLAFFASWLLGSPRTADDNGTVRKRRSDNNQTESSEEQETLENLEFPVYGLETTEFSGHQTDEGSR